MLGVAKDAISSNGSRYYDPGWIVHHRGSGFRVFVDDVRHWSARWGAGERPLGVRITRLHNSGKSATGEIVWKEPE